MRSAFTNFQKLICKLENKVIGAYTTRVGVQ